MSSVCFFSLYFILIGLTLSSLFLKKLENNYVLVFNIWWLFWLLISYLNIGEFYPIDDRTYWYIYSGLIFFNLSLYFVKRNSFNRIDSMRPMGLSVLFMLEILYLLALLYYLFRMYNIVDMFEEYWKVRFIYFGIPFGGITEKLFGMPLETHLFNLLKMFNLVNFLVALVELDTKKYGRLYLVIFNMFLFGILSGGRDFIAYIMIFGIYAFKKKLIFKYFKYILLMCVAVLFMTFLREGGLSKVYMAVVTYFTGAISYFDYLLNNDNGVRYYGELTFSSILAPLSFFLRTLGFNAAMSGMSEVGIELMKFVQLSDTNSFYKLYNALATSFYWQFKDFGYSGIIAINFVLGIFYNNFYSRYNGKCAIVLFAYLEYLMIMSIFSFKFTDLFSMLPILIFLFLFKVNNTKETIRL